MKKKPSGPPARVLKVYEGFRDASLAEIARTPDVARRLEGVEEGERIQMLRSFVKNTAKEAMENLPPDERKTAAEALLAGTAVPGWKHLEDLFDACDIGIASQMNLAEHWLKTLPRDNRMVAMRHVHPLCMDYAAETGKAPWSPQLEIAVFRRVKDEQADYMPNGKNATLAECVTDALQKRGKHLPWAAATLEEAMDELVRDIARMQTLGSVEVHAVIAFRQMPERHKRVVECAFQAVDRLPAILDHWKQLGETRQAGATLRVEVLGGGGRQVDE